MNYTDLLKDPHFSGIIFEIERTIHEIDSDLIITGITLNDTNVKSCIQKTIGHSKGKNPSTPEKNEKEKGMKRITKSLIDLGEEIMSDQEDTDPVSKKEWILSLKATEHSLKLRKEIHGHSRSYLDFLKGFIEDGRLM